LEKKQKLPQMKGPRKDKYTNTQKELVLERAKPRGEGVQETKRRWKTSDSQIKFQASVGRNTH